MNDYQQFLLNKRVEATATGFQATLKTPWPKPFQRDVVQWACELGRAALFAGCGLGKTLMQLLWSEACCQHTGGRGLVLAPLAVGPQTEREAVKFAIPGVNFCRDRSEIGDARIVVTNYQRLLKGHFDTDVFTNVVLDESSILKAFSGKIKKLLCEQFARTPYRLCCTATPAPNDYIELGNHSQFLGVMDSNEMLGRWFISDQGGQKKSERVGGGVGTLTHYRLKGHAEADFWRWVSSWAVCLDKPSDLGYDDGEFILPPLHMHQHVVQADIVDAADGNLFRCDRLTATSLHGEMRRTAAARASKVADLVASAPNETWLVWCNTNYEADALRAVLPAAVEVRGSDKDDVKEQRLTDFSSDQIPLLFSKPSICGFGMNFQHCSHMAFVGLSFSQEQFFQAVRRTWRFGQTRPVECHVVIADSEGEVLASLQRKERQYEEMRVAMKQASTDNKLTSGKRRRLVKVAHEQRSGKGWTLHQGDCVETIRSVADDSIDFTIFSPPFVGLYIYSDAQQDMGNAADDEEFFKHFGYLVPELLRVTVPGRLCAVHCKDLPKYQGRDGVAGLKDFPGQLIRTFEEQGWTFHSRVTIWKCPVIERERTNNHGLLHKTVKRDSSACRQGMADYLLVFRKPTADGSLCSTRPVPHLDEMGTDEEGNEIVVKSGGLDGYEGTIDPRGESGPHPSPYSRRPSHDPALAVWQRYAEPVWWDIDSMDTLNERMARDSKDEKHICPLQLGLIRRCLHLWTNPGDLVLSPFAGIGSEGVVSLMMHRRFVGMELKAGYVAAAERNLNAAAEEASQRDLFDDVEEVEVVN